MTYEEPGLFPSEEYLSEDSPARTSPSWSGLLVALLRWTMANPNKDRGSQWERDIVALLRDMGFTYAERAYGAGRPDDVGDISGLPGLVIEAKNHKTLDFPTWLAEAEVEKKNARAAHGVVFAKRRGKGAADGYAVMRIEDFIQLWKEREDL